jgi:hypothetical protein
LYAVLRLSKHRLKLSLWHVSRKSPVGRLH